MVIRRLAIFLLLGAVALRAQDAAPRLSVAFEVAVADPESGTIRVTMEVRQNVADEVRVSIPAWAPGAYRIMTYAKNGDARRRLYHEYLNRAFPENRETLGTILAKRSELATALGYSTWADYVTEDKMIGSAAKVSGFVERLHEATKERAARDYAMLLARKRKDDPSATAVQEYEKSYYSELVRGEEFAFNSQELRDYFDFPRVKEGILGLTSTLFGVSFADQQHGSVGGHVGRQLELDPVLLGNALVCAQREVVGVCAVDGAQHFIEP